MVDTVPTWLHEVVASRSCPTTVGTPESVRAAFVKERDIFADLGIRYKKSFLHLAETLLCAREMYLDWREDLGISESESRRAVEAGFRAMHRFHQAMQAHGRALLKQVEHENRLAILMLARPYQSDMGINHGICEELRRLGYPVLTQECLPMDAKTLDAVFGAEVARKELTHPLSIDDVWKNSYSENGSRKVWAAKFVARHPRLVAVELSSFKCGHDAPIYSVVEEILAAAGKPLFYFKDLDENRPLNSIRIRLETIAYFLDRYAERRGYAGPIDDCRLRGDDC
jgi:predicted nucleotide-binding protein (sugar kinase/HSP70/actin superfamily)